MSTTSRPVSLPQGRLHLERLALLALGVAAGLVGAHWQAVVAFLKQPQLPTVWWEVLVLIAAAGGVGGLLNGLFVHNGFLLPRLLRPDGRWVLLPGLAGNVGIGAAAALITVFWSTRPVEPGAESFVLTIPILGSAVVAGFAGARALSGRQDGTLLREAVRKALERPASPEDAEQVHQAGSALDVLRLAVGQGRPAPAPAPAPAPPEQTPARTGPSLTSLPALLDRDRVRERFRLLRQAGQLPVMSRDGEAIDLSLLNIRQNLPAATRAFLQGIRLNPTAGCTLAEFLEAVLAVPAEVRPSLEAATMLWASARELKRQLDSLPEGWQLTADELV
jgi:hypothetical protein